MVAAAYATKLMADLGADVIKVEPPKGDRTRFFKGPAAGFFANYCRNKRSFALDTTTPAGQDVARRLIGTADVLIENFRPGLLGRFGLDYASGPPSHRTSSTARLRVICRALTSIGWRSTKSFR